MTFRGRDRLISGCRRRRSARWVEFRVGSNLLALTERGAVFDDPAPPLGALSLQLAFRVAPNDVATCASTLAERGVKIISRANRSTVWSQDLVLP